MLADTGAVVACCTCATGVINRNNCCSDGVAFSNSCFVFKLKASVTNDDCVDASRLSEAVTLLLLLLNDVISVSKLVVPVVAAAGLIALPVMLILLK